MDGVKAKMNGNLLETAEAYCERTNNHTQTLTPITTIQRDKST